MAGALQIDMNLALPSDKQQSMIAAIQFYRYQKASPAHNGPNDIKACVGVLLRFSDTQVQTCASRDFFKSHMYWYCSGYILS